MTTAETFPLVLVDAFSDRPFAGNPAVVVLLPAWPGDHWLQQVAAEMKQSETAFLVAGGGAFELRWFTPLVEVDLCGHATLASAFVLWHLGKARADAPIAFSTRSGTLKAARRGQTIELDFPLEAQIETPAPRGLAQALGITPKYVGKSRFDYLVEVESEAVLRGMAPDFRQLAAVHSRGVIVTARSQREPFDFISRFFAPAAGVDEDPVTGSAHCTLAHFWRERLGKSEFQAYQASARGGVVGVSIRGDRVLLGGTAVIIAQGELQAAGPA